MIAVLLADGFEEIEALGTVDILRRCGEEVKMVAVAENKIVNGGHNISVVADVNIYENYEQIVNANVVVLPGGLLGVENLSKSSKVEELIDKVIKQNGYVAAICAAPTLLSKYGLLKDRVAVCYPGMEDELTCDTYKGDEKAIISGNVITSKAAGTTEIFAQTIMKALGKEQICKEIIAKMYY